MSLNSIQHAYQSSLWYCISNYTKRKRQAKKHQMHVNDTLAVVLFLPNFLAFWSWQDHCTKLVFHLGRRDKSSHWEGWETSFLEPTLWFCPVSIKTASLYTAFSSTSISFLYCYQISNNWFPAVNSVALWRLWVARMKGQRPRVGHSTTFHLE